MRAAGKFRSAIRIERVDGAASADAKSILSVLMLAAARGTSLKISAEGADEMEASRAIGELFEQGFGELANETECAETAAELPRFGN